MESRRTIPVAVAATAASALMIAALTGGSASGHGDAHARFAHNAGNLGGLSLNRATPLVKSNVDQDAASESVFDDSSEVINQLTFTAPVAGTLVIHGSATASTPSAEQQRLQPALEGTVLQAAGAEVTGGGNVEMQLAYVATAPVSKGQATVSQVLSRDSTDDQTWNHESLVVQFYPAARVD